MSGLTSEQSAIIRFEISYDNFNCFRVNKDLKSNRIFMLAAVTKSCHALQYASSELKKDSEVVLEAIKKNWQAIQYVSDDPNGFRTNKSFMQLALKVDVRSLQYASVLLRDNSEFMLSALSNAVQKDRLYGSLAFMYASDALKVDQNFILKAVGITIHVLEYVSREFRTNRAFILEAVKKNGNSLRYTLDDAFTADREIVLAAFTTAPSILLIASDALKQDPEIVTAVKKNLKSLPYAPQLSGNRDFMLEVVKQNWQALKYASPVLKEDCEIVEAAIDQDPSLSWRALYDASNKIRNNRDVVLKALKQDWRALEYASLELRKDHRIVMEAVRKKRRGTPYSILASDWHALQFASKDLRDDRDFMLEIIVDVNWAALQYASDTLKKDPRFVLSALKQNSQALLYVSPELRCKQQFIAMLILETNISIDDMKEFGVEFGSITNNQVGEVWAFKEALEEEKEVAKEETASCFSKVDDIDGIYRRFPLHYITYNSFEGIAWSEERLDDSQKDELLKYRFELLKSANANPLVVLAIQNLNLGEGEKDPHVMECSSMDAVQALVGQQFLRLVEQAFLMTNEPGDAYEMMRNFKMDISNYVSYDKLQEAIQSTIKNAVGRSSPSCGL